MPRSNPNKANQYKFDPRQSLCWDFYIDPGSPTFSNAKRSAIRAGYDDSYAEHILKASWYCGKVRQFDIVTNAEKALGDILDMPIDFVSADNYGKDGTKLTLATDTSLLRIKANTAMFVVDRLGGEEWAHPRISKAKKQSVPYPLLYIVVRLRICLLKTLLT